VATLFDEIAEQPRALSSLRKYYSSPGVLPSRNLRSLVPGWPPLVVFTGMGSSLFAAYPAQAFLTANGIRAVLWETSELLHYHLRFLGPDTLLVVISQSGETIEVTRLLACIPPGVNVVGVGNVTGSTLQRRAALFLPMLAGAQDAVSTKTYTCAVAALMYLAFALAERDPEPLTQALNRIAETQERILERRGVTAPSLAEYLGLPPYMGFLARGADLSTAHQGALMFKEVARLGAESASGGEFRHGPIEIVTPAQRYIVIARRGEEGGHEETAKLMLTLADDIRACGGRVLLFTDVPAAKNLSMRTVAVNHKASALDID